MLEKSLQLQPLTRSEKSFIFTFMEMLKEMDFEKIHVSDILRRSGFSRGAFYSHFEDKYDLADKIIKREMQIYFRHSVSYVKALETGSEHSELLQIVREFMEHVYDYRNLYDAILDSRFPTITLDEFCSKLITMFNERVATTLTSEAPDCDQSLYDYVEFYSSILHIKYWRTSGYRFSPEDMAEKILSLISKQAYKFRTLEG